jgi:putative ABC transport system permease protein
MGAARLLARAAVLGPLFQAPGRTALSVVAIALGVALGMAIHLIHGTAAAEVYAATRSLFGEADLVVQGGSEGFDEALFPVVARTPGVTLASPVVEVQARLEGRRETLRIQGLDPLRAGRLLPALSTGEGGSSIDIFSDDALYLSPAAAQALGLREGDRLPVRVGTRPVELRVAGLLPGSAFSQSIGVMDIAAAQWRLDRLGRLSRIDLRLAPGAEPAEVSAALAKRLPPDVQVTTPALEAREALSLSRAYRVNLTALSLVALFTGGFLVFSTQALAVLRRRRQLALLRALGTARGALARWVLAEAAVVGAVGAALGVALGYALAAFVLATLGADLGAGYFPHLAARVQATPWTWAGFFALGVAVSVLGALAPALEAARVAPAQALKAGDEERPLARLPWRAPGTVALGLAAAFLWLPPVDGLPLGGYAAIVFLLLGAVLLLPAFTRRAFGALPVRGPAWAQVAAAHLKGTAGQVTVSVAAVLVSGSLMVSMAIMVASFRHSLDAWLEKVLPGDLYLRAGFAGESAFLDAAFQETLAGLPGVVRFELARSVEIVLAPDRPPVTLIARPMGLNEARERLWLTREAPGLPGEADPLWVSESFADLYGVAPGSPLVLPLAGRPVTFRVQGIWRDYARPEGAAVLDLALYRRLTGDSRATTATLWLAPGASADSVAAGLRERLPKAVFEMSVPGDIRAASLSIFDRTFAVTYALEAVAVLIGLFGVSAAAGSQVLARRGEFGMLRHVGMTRREIGAMLAFEGGWWGFTGVLAGNVLGFVVGLILIHVVNRQSFHWSMDLHPPWGLLVLLAAGLVAAAAVTAVASGRQAMGMEVVRVVREDW